MEGAIVLIILILLGVLIVPIIVASGTNSRVRDMSNQLRMIEAMLQDVRKQLKNEHPEKDSNEESEISYAKLEEPIQEIYQEHESTTAIVDAKPTEAIVSEDIIVAQEPIKEPESIEEISLAAIEETPIESAESINATEQIHDSTITQKPKIKQDIERFIGEKLMSLVGIAILVLGIFFTVKWAIDKKLIGDAGKVLIGILSGTILMGVAHRIRKSYHAFSSILVGGGLAVLYFTIYIAFQDYHLLSQTPAFIAMIVITIFAVLLSILYNRIELAVIALIGGFATPFFVSNNEGNYQVLFTYLLVLNVGMFILANYKKWNLINIISYVATVLIYLGWITTKFDPNKGHAIGSFIFASLFYLVFFGMNVVYNLRNNTKFKAIEIGMLLSNTFLYFSAGMYSLSFINAGFYQGVFSIAIALFNFGFAYSFYKKKQVDKNLVYLLIGIVLTFVSLTAPIQLHGNYITLFWSAEMVLLYWLGQKSGIQLIRNTSVIVMGLAITSLIIDWIHIYDINGRILLPIIINKAFIASAVLFIALSLQRKLATRDENSNIFWSIPMSAYRILTQLLCLFVLYMMFLLELTHQLSSRIHINSFTTVAIWIYHYLFIGLLFIYFKKAHISVRQIISLASTFILILYIFAGKAIFSLQQDTFSGVATHSMYLWHYLIPIFAGINLFLLIHFVQKNIDKKSEIFQYAAWLFTFLSILILSNEIVHTWAFVNYEAGSDLLIIRTKAIKIALPILWSVCSLILMLIGMKLKVKTYRIISLSLFTLTIIKLFVYDISNVGQGGKIAAFIILGVILLVVSFLYQKIKGLFIDQENDEQNKLDD